MNRWARMAWACFILMAGLFANAAAYAQAVNIAEFAFDVRGHETQPGKAQQVLSLRAAAWVGEPLDDEHLKNWQAGLTDVLRASGYPIGLVVATMDGVQEATQSGHLTLLVFLGEIGKLDIANTSRVDDARIRRIAERALCEEGFGIDAGCVLESARLERTTQLLQDVPGIALSAAPSLDTEGVGPGKTHLTITTAANGDPFSAGLAVDNQGSHSTGLVRLGTSLSGNNLFGAGDSYNASIFKTEKKMWSGSAGMSAPLGHDGLRMSAAAGRSFYTVNQGIVVDGMADTFSAGVNYPFVRGLDANVNGAADLVHTRAKVDYPGYGLHVHSSLSSLRLTLAANNGDRAQQLGMNQYFGNVALTLGRQRNDDSLDSGPRRAGSYLKLALSAVHRRNLDERGDFFAVVNLRGQITNRNVDSSEMLALGGVNGSRAYRSDEGSVNQGAIASLDVKHRFPLPWGDQVLPGVFVDVASGQLNRKTWPGWEAGYPNVGKVSNHRTLSSVGVSLDYVTTSGLTTSISVARRLPFSQDSWVKPGSAQSRVWVTFSWRS